MNNTLKVLTIIQPWASLIIDDGKTIENRGFKTRHRGLMGIHAGAKPVAPLHGWQREERTRALKALDHELPRGALLGVVEVVDVTQDHVSPWAEPGQWHWVFANPRALPEPVPMRGKLGLWDIDLAAPWALPAPLVRFFESIGLL